MKARARLRVIALSGAIAAAFLAGASCRKSNANNAPAGPHGTVTRAPYTPVRPPPTRTLKPGEPTPLPRLPE